MGRFSPSSHRYRDVCGSNFPANNCPAHVTFSTSFGLHVEFAKPDPKQILNTLTDNALMLRVKEDDLQPMGLLFKRYHRELFGFFYHMSSNPDASEDMVQTAFYRMIKYRHSFSGEGAFRSWMYQLARNVLLDFARQNNPTRQQHNVADYAERIAGGALADESILKTEQAFQLKQALDQLTAAHREILVMSEYQELKYKEIAQILDITEGAVKVRVHRAMNELRTIYLNREQQH